MSLIISSLLIGSIALTNAKHPTKKTNKFNKLQYLTRKLLNLDNIVPGENNMKNSNPKNTGIPPIAAAIIIFIVVSLLYILYTMFKQMINEKNKQKTKLEYNTNNNNNINKYGSNSDLNDFTNKKTHTSQPMSSPFTQPSSIISINGINNLIPLPLGLSSNTTDRQPSYHIQIANAIKQAKKEREENEKSNSYSSLSNKTHKKTHKKHKNTTNNNNNNNNRINGYQANGLNQNCQIKIVNNKPKKTHIITDSCEDSETDSDEELGSSVRN